MSRVANYSGFLGPNLALILCFLDFWNFFSVSSRGYKDAGLLLLVTVAGFASALRIASASECCRARRLSSATLELRCSCVASRGCGGGGGGGTGGPREAAAAATAATAAAGLWCGGGGGPGGGGGAPGPCPGGGGGKCDGPGPGCPWMRDGQHAHMVKPETKKEDIVD